MKSIYNPFLQNYEIYGETLPEKGTRLAKEAMQEFEKKAMEKIRLK